MRHVAALLGVFLVCGSVIFVTSSMSPARKTTLVDSVCDEYEITGISYSKHSSVDLKNLRTGEILDRVSVGRRFNFRNAEAGKKIKLTRKLWKYSDGSTSWSFDTDELKSAIEAIK